METNVWNADHLDANDLLPPRKRLLAGFKKQSSNLAPSPSAADDAPTSLGEASLSSSATPSTPSPTSTSLRPHLTPPSPIPCSPSSSEFQTRLDNLLDCYFSSNRNVSPDKIVEASKTVAENAVNAAKVAQTAAQEKAVAAARAMAAAKSALALVGSFPEEADIESRHLKKNKPKKHVQVQLLYEKHKLLDNHGKDRVLAHNSLRVMNSSPRISTKSSGSNSEGHKTKRHKSSIASNGTRNYDGGKFVKETSPANGHAVAGDLGSEDSMQGTYTTTINKFTNYKKANQSQTDDSEAESNYPRERHHGDASSPGKRKGKLKLKKLPLL